MAATTVRIPFMEVLGCEPLTQMPAQIAKPDDAQKRWISVETGRGRLSQSS